MKQMEVTIMGQSYLLGCPEGGEAALTKAVARVDKEMCAIRDAGRIKARERIAVLAALNLAFSLSDSAAGADGDATNATPGETRAAGTPNEALPDLETLMKRLDEALVQDGQLL
ncbi:cell division protein ZapA [Roseateles chitosanitabidus]|jgi:cell division protein ZapA|uniref:cell division protein ZapA n=1 Tax=Roseateles chitosanitabidus TaxID=65048 RepID=UPI000834D8C4|nr:cell division protein ZapA [Roseateles chitosanitabidus]MBO9686162.1 cell division protein ZapA [Roseateles chitosanitabidus]